jgi:hypothetical protein
MVSLDQPPERMLRMKSGKTGKDMTIVGFIRAVEWDDFDDVVSVAISTDENDYIVELNKKGKELFDLLDEEVTVTGIIKQDSEGNFRIAVGEYAIIESDDDLDDFEEDDDDDYDEDDFDDFDDYDDDDDDIDDVDDEVDDLDSADDDEESDDKK